MTLTGKGKNRETQNLQQDSKHSSGVQELPGGILNKDNGRTLAGKKKDREAQTLQQDSQDASQEIQ